jgi:hypothetical protein
MWPCETSAQERKKRKEREREAKAGSEKAQRLFLISSVRHRVAAPKNLHKRQAPAEKPLGNRKGSTCPTARCPRPICTRLGTRQDVTRAPTERTDPAVETGRRRPRRATPNRASPPRPLSNPKRRDWSPKLCIGADHDTTSRKRQGEGALVSCVLSPARVQSTTGGLPSKPKRKASSQGGCCVSRRLSSPIQRGKGRGDLSLPSRPRARRGKCRWARGWNGSERGPWQLERRRCSRQNSSGGR